MDNGIAKELLDELIPHFEAVETQSAAILQFLKDKGIATEKNLAPHLDEAGKASNVRWRASRLRIERLLSSLIEEVEKTAKQAGAEKAAEPEVPPGEAPKKSEETKRAEAAEKEATANAEDHARGAPSKVPAAEKPDAARQQSEEQTESEKELPQDQKDAA